MMDGNEGLREIQMAIKRVEGGEYGNTGQVEEGVTQFGA